MTPLLTKLADDSHPWLADILARLPPGIVVALRDDGTVAVCRDLEEAERAMDQRTRCHRTGIGVERGD